MYFRCSISASKGVCCETGFLPLNTAAVISLSYASVSGWLHIYSPYLQNVEKIWDDIAHDATDQKMINSYKDLQILANNEGPNGAAT